MKSIFNKIDNETMIARINALTVENQPVWGKMSVDQMCKHCSLAIDVAHGKLNLKINFIFRLLGKMLKKKMITGNSFGQGSPTAKEFIVTNHYILEEVKSELIEKVQTFSTHGKSSIKLMNHPFWGKLTHDEWDILMWKHLDHHLSQFGV